MTETAKLEALTASEIKHIAGALRMLNGSGDSDLADKIERFRPLSVTRPAVKGLETRAWEHKLTGIVRQLHDRPSSSSLAEGDYEPLVRQSDHISVLAEFALSSLSPPTGTGEPLTFGYTNWRGEYAERTAIPLRIERKESEWHGPGLHYVMVAFDVEKQAERDFLLTDMGRLPSPPEAE